MLRSPFIGSIWSFISLCAVTLPARAAPVSAAQSTNSPNASFSWQSEAQLNHLFTKTQGAITISNRGLEFRPVKGSPLEWSVVDIRSFFLTPRRLTMVSYEDRAWHLPGERKFSFDLKQTLPPLTAEAFARLVAKPVRNGDPDPRAPAFAMTPARHSVRVGGTNGILRFRQTGIDYVTPSGQDARSWRWSDIETLANPDPYHFRVSAYREIFDFDLKQPMSPRLFDRLWNYIYARGLQVNLTGGAR